MRAEVSRLQVALKADEVKFAGLEEDRLRLREEQTGLEKDLGELIGRAERFVAKKISLMRDKEERRSEAEQHLQALRQKKVEIQDLDRDLARMTAHWKVLNDLNRKFEGYSEGDQGGIAGPARCHCPDRRIQIAGQNHGGLQEVYPSR